MIKFFRNLLGGNSNEHRYLEKDISNLKNNITDSFSKIKDDISSQKKWIDHLYNSNNDLSKLQDNLKAHHDNHKSIHAKDIESINKDITHINSWISHLHSNQSKHEDNVMKLETSIRGAFNTYNKYLLDLYKIVHSLKEDKSSMKEDVETLIDVDRRPYEDKALINNAIDTVQTYANVDPISASEETDNPLIDDSYEVDKGPLMNMSENLTRSQKMILAHMMNTEQKLSYKDLSMLMTVSVSTIKNHICNMRNKGFPLQEYSDEGNIKRYYLAENMKQILVSKRF